MVTREFLDSDRVNFLIWRYLLEGNYRETAAKFQKEWCVRAPHRDFDFAPYVQCRALISIVQKGLVYYAIERELAKQKCLVAKAAGSIHAQRRPQLMDMQQAVTQVEEAQFGIFGPLNAQTPAKSKIQHDDQRRETGTGVEAGAAPPSVEKAEDAEASRKRVQRPISQGSPTKRPRLSNGYDSGADGEAGLPTTTAPKTANASTPMEIDQLEHQDPTASPPLPPPPPPPPPPPHDNSQHNGNNNQAYPSPLEGEQLPPPIPQTDGPEQGTQVDKVEELSSDTTFIRLMDDDGTPSEMTPSPSPADSQQAPVLLQCEWNPRDPSVLAAAGTDALARVWTVSRATASESGQDHVSPRALSLLDPDTPRSTTVTALSWATDGTAISIAADWNSHAVVSIWTADGARIQTMEVTESPVVKLCWNPGSTALLAISPEQGGALISIYLSLTSTAVTWHLAEHDITNTPLDAAWTSDTEFLLCGGDLFLCFRCAESSIVQVRRFETRDDDSFTQVLYDGRSKLAATSCDKGILDLWDEFGQRRAISAHQGAITAMAWQPLPAAQVSTDDERLIATGGDDCAILIWNARKPESKAKCFLTMDSPIVGIAFTPNGTFVAGATSRQVLIWKVDNHAMPRANWNRPPHRGWLSPRGSSESDEEDEHCLCWDVSGQQLAYGSNSRLAVINFSP